MNTNTATIDSFDEEEGQATIYLKWEGNYSVEDFNLSILGNVAACGNVEPGVG